MTNNPQTIPMGTKPPTPRSLALQRRALPAVQTSGNVLITASATTLPMIFTAGTAVLIRTGTRLAVPLISVHTA